MPKGEGFFDRLRVGVQTEEEIAVRSLFPYTDKFKMLQMINEQQPKSITPWSVLGIFRRLYGSKILRMFQEEYNLNKISQERKGRLELSEIFAGRRSLKEKEEE